MFHCDDEPASFYRWEERKARKQYQCCECRASIEKGELYFWSVGCWQGDVVTQRQHLDCCAACMLIRDEIDGECIPFGMLFDWWFEYRRDEPSDPKKLDAWKRLRSLLARIKWRERQHKQRSNQP